MAISVKGAHFPQAIMLIGVRCYAAYPLSARQHSSRLQAGRVPSRRAWHWLLAEASPPSGSAQAALPSHSMAAPHPPPAARC